MAPVMMGEVLPAEVRDPQPAAPSRPRGFRWRALDLLRFVAVVMMVQGHAFFVLLSDAERTASWYRYHNYIHGLTAPLFLFSAGAAFGISTFGRWEQHGTWGPAFRKRAGRYLLLIAIGYILHLPRHSLWAAFRVTDPAALNRILKVDALQHIGVMLLILQTMALWIRERRRYTLTTLALGGILVLIGPWMWRLPFDQWLPRGVAGYFNANTGSIFPITPWGGFICAGLSVAYLVHGTSSGWRLSYTALGGPVLIFLGWSLNKTSFEPWGEHNFWKTSPYFFLLRLGMVVSALGLLCAWEHWLVVRHKEKPGPLLRFIQVLGQETLVIYVVHLIVLYGSPFVRSEHWRALGLQRALWASAALLAAMAWLAWLWNWTKKRRPRLHAATKAAIAATAAWSLLLRGM